ncbi:hypothetical protein [Denitrobaculum tricleocarpae]|nr:hypothetical protein [Denitrobaculum tricleocarpae]
MPEVMSEVMPAKPRVASMLRAIPEVAPKLLVSYFTPEFYPRGKAYILRR